MSDATIPQADQGGFLEYYRGRQGAIHHAAYMRMAKVLLALFTCGRIGFDLAGRDVFDYGFGAGTFYRYCPKSARLFGVEIDPQSVAEVSQMLAERGHMAVDLQTIEIEKWAVHPLLERQFDFILCSHVIEHIPKPIEFLERMGRCLRPGGVFIALVPLNERKMDPHHVQPIFETKVRTWARAAGLHTYDWLEADPWLYWIQPLFTHDTGWRHKAAQLVSLAIGIPATLLGPERWWKLSQFYATLTRSKPTQAVFVLRKEPLTRSVLPSPFEKHRAEERRFSDHNMRAL